MLPLELGPVQTRLLVEGVTGAYSRYLSFSLGLKVAPAGELGCDSVTDIGE
jgi:hypothetical protein